jgi:ankyrin repeat protein
MKNAIDQDLLSAVLSNCTPLVETLLKTGVDGKATNAYGVTALHFAAESYSVDAARVLLRAVAKSLFQLAATLG